VRERERERERESEKWIERTRERIGLGGGVESEKGCVCERE